MLPKEKRIPRDLFSQITDPNSPIGSRYKHIHTPSLSLRVANSTEPFIRVSVSVSKKVAKKASDRNKIRRRIYSSIKNLLPNLKKGYYLISAKPEAVMTKTQDIEKDIEKALNKEGFIEKRSKKS